MEKILFTDKTNLLAFNEMLKSINTKDKNIIIVPDKFSLNAEQLFFEVKNLKVNFSTTIFSLTKLASEILKSKLKDLNIIDKNIEIMILSSIIKQNLNNFKYFKNIKDINKFTIDIFNLISQILSSNLQMLDENIDCSFKNKIHDLNLILKEYLLKRKENLVDASFKFDLFLKEIKNSTFIKEHNIYFGMFYNLTSQMKDIIKEISLYAKSVTFSCGVVENRVNNNEIYEFFKSLNCKIVESNNLGSEKQFIVDNFFTSKKEKQNLINNNIKIFEAKNVEEEIDNLVYNIKNEIFINKLRFKDIGVFVSDFKIYKNLIEKKFKKAGFSYFFDIGVKLSETSFARFVLDLINCFKNFNLENVLKVIKYKFINYDNLIKENFEKYIIKYNLLNLNSILIEDEFLNDFLFIKNNFVDKIEKISKQKFENSNEFFIVLKDFLNDEKIFEKLNEIIEGFREEDLTKYKYYLQVEDKVFECFDNIEKFYKEEFSFEKLLFFVNLCFDNLNVSTVPTSVDSIFIGDGINSYYKEYKTMFIIGADSKKFPFSSKDTCLFNDEELKIIEKDKKISPKINDVNVLNYYKCFEALLIYKNSLTISYSSLDEGGKNYPSIFIKMFLNKFNKNNGELKIFKINSEPITLKNANDILNLLPFKYSNLKDIAIDYFKMENGLKKEIFNKILQDKYNFIFKENEFNKQKVDLGSNVFSSSGLENYFTCSYKYFYKNILKLEKFLPLKIDAKIIGNIVHGSVCEFSKTDIECLDLNKQKEIIDKVINRKDFEFLKNNKENLQILSNLKNEILKLFAFIVNQQKTSEFKLKYAEFKFVKEIAGINFKGFVDRIDVCDNDFIIIDYKTGTTKIDYNEIIIGKKIQLILYAYILEKVLNKKCRGVYYLSVSDDFKTKTQNKIFLNGITVNTSNTKRKLNNDFENEYFDFNEKFCLNEKQFKNLCDYVFNKIKDGVKKINSSEFKENPIVLKDERPCVYCDYNEICCGQNKEIVEINEDLIKDILND